EARRHLQPGERALAFAGDRDAGHEVRGATQIVMHGAAVDLERPKVIEQARPRRLARAIEADGDRLVVRLIGRAPGSTERDEAHAVAEVDDRVEAAERIGVLALEPALLELGGRGRSEPAPPGLAGFAVEARANDEQLGLFA